MDDVQVQPWFQYEDGITMFSGSSVKDAMNKELSQLITIDHKRSFVEVDKRSLTWLTASFREPQQKLTTVNLLRVCYKSLIRAL
eukprot:2860851-Amphidinium_carterae.1